MSSRAESGPPHFWGRYVDDVLVIIRREEIDKFLSHINNQHPAIKFTIEREVEGKIPMLDVAITRKGSGGLKFQVYCKPTHRTVPKFLFSSPTTT